MSGAVQQIKLAVLVTGKSEAEVRRFLAAYVKPAFGMRKNQWRVSYRKQYALTVLSRPLRAGEDPQAAYGRFAAGGALVLAGLAAGVAGSGREAARGWLLAQGFAPVVELELEPLPMECAMIDQGAQVVNFINGNCPWRANEFDGLNACPHMKGKACGA
jgi:hypothetical protein